MNVKMDKVIEVDLVYLLKIELNVNEWLTILKIWHNSKGEDIPFMTTNNSLDSLKEKGYIDIIDDDIYLKRKGDKLFANEVINFDDLYMLYPYKTPNGRVLRAKNKEILGSLTRDYKALSKRYHSSIKNVETHNKVIEFTHNMINDHRKTGKMDFMLKLETYINQRGWERYTDNVSDNSFNMEKL